MHVAQSYPTQPPDDYVVGDVSELHPVQRARRLARDRLRCATCGASIERGERYRHDTWRARVFGTMLASAICAECQAIGL